MLQILKLPLLFFLKSTALKKVEEAAAIYEKAAPEKETLLSKLLERRHKYSLSMLDVTAIMTDLLIGGVDTTSTTLYYLLYELGVNPGIQEKLYQEISQVLKPDEEITGEKLSQLKYLKCVVKENFRYETFSKIFLKFFIMKQISFSQTYAPNKTKMFKSGFGFAIFSVFGFGLGWVRYFANLLQISN